MGDNFEERWNMRRILSIILVFSLLAVPVARAEGERYVALTFDDGPSG